MYITRFLLSLRKNLKYQRLLNEAYNKDEIIAKLSTALGTQVQRDWIGRLYAVVNPFVQDGKYNPEGIYEVDAQDKSNYDEWVLGWVMRRLDVISKFIMAENLFDLLTYSLTKLDDQSNYLFIIQPITLADTIKKAKQACWWLGASAVAAGLFCIFI